MKRFLVVSPGNMRSDGEGLTSSFLNVLSRLDSFLRVDLLDISFNGSVHSDRFKADQYYSPFYSIKKNIILNIPKLRVFYHSICVNHCFLSLLKKKQYDLIIFYYIPFYASIMIREAKRNNIKVALYPWGSDVLRVKYVSSYLSYYTFKHADFILGYRDSGVIRKALEKYKIPSEKLYLFDMVSSIVGEILVSKGKFSRAHMSSSLNIPFSKCNIVCGYNGSPSQQHIKTLSQISKILNLLPHDYQVIIPTTYGRVEKYNKKIRDYCINKKINAIFIEEYLTKQQMAFLHLITDIYINNYLTDNGNAFLIESLVCENVIFSGSWLNYRQFEKYGVPYYQFDSQESLLLLLSSFFSGKIAKLQVPPQLIDDILNNKIENYLQQWVHFIDIINNSQCG